ncbi:transcription factor 20-like isoform X2 [Ornithodoros turicata]
MSNTGPPYQGCVGPGMNYTERPYENQMGSHCQANNYPAPYQPPSPYRPHAVSPPTHYGGHIPSAGQPGQQQQQQHPAYANGPSTQGQPPSMVPYSQQQYNNMAQGDMMYPRHAYPNSRMKPWGVTPESNGGGYPARPPMMGSPPPMRSPPAQPLNYRQLSNVAGPPQSHSPSWAQSPRTTPSPLAGHARSPVQPFSPPPTPAHTPQLKPPTPPVAQQVGGPNDPLQSLQKMVMLDSDVAEAVDRYDMQNPVVDQRYETMPHAHQPPYVHGAEGTASPGSPYPTYYNLDQNRMCTPPRPMYGNMCSDVGGGYQMTPVNGEVVSDERTGGAPGYQAPMVNGSQAAAASFQAAPRESGMRMDMQYPPQQVGRDMSMNSSFIPENTGVGPHHGEVGKEVPHPSHPGVAARPAWPPPPDLMVAPSSEDLTKRRRSSDSVLCGGGEVGLEQGNAQQRPVMSRSRGGGTRGKGRRRSTASLPEGPTFSDGAGSSDAIMPAQVPLFPNVPQQQDVPKIEPSGMNSSTSMSNTESLGSEGNINVAPGVTPAPAVGGAAPTADPPRKKRGRPFGSKNKKKNEDGSSPAKSKKGSAARKVEAALQAPPTAPPTMQAPPTLTASRPPRAVAGPYIHVEGTRERPLSSSIVNSVSRLEDEAKKKKGADQGGQQGPRPRQHPRRKLLGVHTSTLSPGYDAFTRDPTWVCSLCHKGSHHSNLGDLYGPYSVGEEIDATSVVVQQTGGEGAGTSGEGGATRGRARRRRSEVEEVIVRGAKKAKQRRPSDAEEKSTSQVASHVSADGEGLRELWVHEDCAIWTQGIYLVGHRIRGIEEAIREAADLPCSKCKFVGATLACVMRGCKEKYHYLCAVERGCQLDSENFSVRCPKHKKPAPS